MASQDRDSHDVEVSEGVLAGVLGAVRDALLVSSRGYRAATALLVVLLSVAAVARYPINHDLGAHLDLTSRMLDGERLYSRIVEPNPPLVFYLYVPVVLLSRLLGVPGPSLVGGYLLAALFLCAGAAYRLLCHLELPASRTERRLVLWLVLYVFTALAGYDFGQRDPMAAALTLPYAIAAAGRAQGKAIPGPLALLTGALAAFGFALKPYFAVLWLLTEGYLLVVRRRLTFWRPENLVVMGFVGLFGLWVALGTEYVANLRLVMLSYVAYQESLLDVLSRTHPKLWVLAFALLLLLRAPDSDHELHVTLGIALAAFLYSGVAQMKGWSYHVQPAISLSYLVIGVALLGAVETRADLSRVLRIPRAGVSAGAVLLLIVLSASGAWRAVTGPDWFDGPLVRTLASVIRRSGDGKGIAWLTTSCYPAYPSTNYGGARGVLTLGTWPLASLYSGVHAQGGRFPYHPLSEMSPVEHLVYDRLVEDLERTAPELIAFDRGPVKQGFGRTAFDFEEYFSRDPRFRAILEGEYEPLVQVGDFRFYKRRVRAPPAPT